MTENELYHYGVKGMRWGVITKKPSSANLTKDQQKKILRRMSEDKYAYIGSKPPRHLAKYRHDKYMKEEHPDIKKGTTVQHISPNKKIDLKSRQFYVTHDEQDKTVYKYALAKYHTKGKHYIHEYTLKTDLKIPSQWDNAKMLSDAMWKTGKESYKEILSFALKNPEVVISKSGADRIRKLGPTYSDVYKMFNYSLTDPNVFKTKIGKAYKKELESNGYNAIVDYKDTYHNRIATDAIILLNGKKCLTKTKVSELTEKDIDEGKKKLDKILSTFS